MRAYVLEADSCFFGGTGTVDSVVADFNLRSARARVCSVGGAALLRSVVVLSAESVGRGALAGEGVATATCGAGCAASTGGPGSCDNSSEMRV